MYVTNICRKGIINMRNNNQIKNKHQDT